VLVSTHVKLLAGGGAGGDGGGGGGSSTRLALTVRAAFRLALATAIVYVALLPLLARDTPTLSRLEIFKAVAIACAMLAVVLARVRPVMLTPLTFSARPTCSKASACCGCHASYIAQICQNVCPLYAAMCAVLATSEQAPSTAYS
jgi:hypothetical protein